MGVDKMGTMFASARAPIPQALPVYVGSHLDTQPTGGRYDGVLGVLGGLEVIRTLNDLGIKTKHPIVVTNWTNEEGTRFAPAMLASGVFAGIHDLDWAYDRTDAKGKKFGDELKRIGWQGDEEVGARKMHAFFELHIEQGPILEAEGKEIGVVTHGQGLSWTQITLTGKDAHTGSTPMPMRKNAGLGMARILELVDQIAWSHAPHAVGAAGQIEVYPEFAQRHSGQGGLHGRFPLARPCGAQGHGGADSKAGAQKIAADMGLGIEMEKVGGFDPVTFDAELRDAPSAMRPSGSATRTATSSRAPATTPAGSTASPRRPWSCAPASAAFRTTRPRKSRRNGPPRAATCCSMPWSKRPESWSDNDLERPHRSRVARRSCRGAAACRAPWLARGGGQPFLCGRFADGKKFLVNPRWRHFAGARPANCCSSMPMTTRP